MFLLWVIDLNFLILSNSHTEKSVKHWLLIKFLMTSLFMAMKWALSNVFFVCACYYTLLNREWDRVPVTQVLCFAAQGKIKVQLSQTLNKTQRETLKTEKKNTQEKKEQCPSLQTPWALRCCKPSSKPSLRALNLIWLLWPGKALAELRAALQVKSLLSS